MSSAENQQQTFPTVPPSFSAGDHEMRDYYASQDASRPTLNQAPYLTPYLSLRARLSQIWINRWTILLFLVLVRTLLAISSINDSINTARADALSACTSVEAVGSAMASMPHYLSQGVNEMAASGVEKAVNGLMSMLSLTVTGIEEIVLFVINLMTSTYVCLITMAVSGSLHAALSLVEDISGFLNQTLGDIGNDLGSVASGFQTDLNKFVSALNSIPFVNDKVPTLNITGDINKLKGVSIPSSFTADLQKLNSSIPNFQDVNNFTNNLIRLPFEEVKTLINESLHTFEFNRSLLPVPAKEQLSFCTNNDGIDNFFDELIKLAIIARKIFIAVLTLAAILVCLPMAWWETKRFQTMQQRSRLVSKQAIDPLDVIYIASRPRTSAFGIQLANRFRSVRHQTLVRWSIAYATSPPALFVLSLGIAGLFSCLCQYILLQTVKKEAPQLENAVANFAEKVVNSLNNASQNWAVQTNNVINKTNTDINHDVFGWVNTSTTAVNNTLNGFVNAMSEGLNKTFGGTILYAPIQDVLNCLITLKIVGIEKGLTWVHDNAHFDFPSLPNNTFSLGALASVTNSTTDEQLLTSPGSTTKDDISAAVTKLVNKVQEGIKHETIISACVLLLWVLIALFGFIRIMFAYSGRGKLRGEGGQAYVVDPVTGDQRGEGDWVANNPSLDAAPPYQFPAGSKEPYVLQPRPFPDETTSTADDEKVGDASRNLNVVEPTHLRTSSYGHVGGHSPIDEKSRDPFADSSR